MGETPARGRLKVFLGYAAGVGKTYQMLSEAQELKSRGVDVVIGYFEPHTRPDTIAMSEGLETVPRKAVDYRGSRFEEMDTDAVLRRHPAVAVVDEFPHTNVPGSATLKRWEDVQVLLDAGIDVLTTMNVQHLESLNDQIWQSTGVRVRETIPDWVVRQADEVVMVDLDARRRCSIGSSAASCTRPERAKAALQNFFREPTLVALRELAMRQTAHAVEARQHRTTRRPGPRRRRRECGRRRAAAAVDRSESGQRRADSARPAGRRLPARRMSGRLRLADAGRVGVDARPSARASTASSTSRAASRSRRASCRAPMSPRRVVSFARLHGVTQIFVNRQKVSAAQSWLGRALVQRIVNLAGDMQVTIVADRSVQAHGPVDADPRHFPKSMMV